MKIITWKETLSNKIIYQVMSGTSWCKNFFKNSYETKDELIIKTNFDYKQINSLY